jgi:hypothetical protein
MTPQNDVALDVVGTSAHIRIACPTAGADGAIAVFALRLALDFVSL